MTGGRDLSVTSLVGEKDRRARAMKQPTRAEACANAVGRVLFVLLEVSVSKLRTARGMKWTTVSFLGFSILFALGLLLVSRNVAVGPAIIAQQADDYGAQAAAAAAEVAAATPPSTSAAAMAAPLPASCIGKEIYIYDLPPEFNTDLLASYCRGEVPGMQFMCGIVVNGGLGPPITDSVGQPLPPVEQMVVMSPHKDESTARVRANLRFYQHLWAESQRALVPASAWYATELFSLEQVFHSRMQAYPCRTPDPARAALLYVPYYASLDLDRYMYDLVPARDWLANRLLGWLTAHPAWRARRGRHLLVLGRDAWDFSRKLHDTDAKAWGVALLTLPPFVPALKLLVERNLHEATQAAVPYPTGFHPASDADLAQWRAVVAAARRDTLVSFAGARRTTDTGTVAVALRDRLVAECAAADDARCTVLDCGDVDCTRFPRLVWALNLRSTFCLQPEGDNPTRRATFDALVTGCIPVFFTAQSAYLQYTWHLPANFTSWSVFVPAESRELVVPVLAAIPEHQVRAMRDTVLGFMENVVYAMPGHDRERSFKDAIDIAIDRALAMVNNTTGTTSEAAAPAAPESLGS